MGWLGFGSARRGSHAASRYNGGGISGRGKFRFFATVPIILGQTFAYGLASTTVPLYTRHQICWVLKFSPAQTPPPPPPPPPTPAGEGGHSESRGLAGCRRGRWASLRAFGAARRGNGASLRIGCWVLRDPMN